MSPTVGRVIEYDDDEILQELSRMAEEAKGTSWSAGRSIYKQACFCMSPERIKDADAQCLLDDYRLSEALGVPVAATLDQVPAMYADAVLVIRHELAHITKALGERRNG